MTRHKSHALALLSDMMSDFKCKYMNGSLADYIFICFSETSHGLYAKRELKS